MGVTGPLELTLGRERMPRKNVLLMSPENEFLIASLMIQKAAMSVFQVD